ncbi:hypothetical protein JG688_00005398 [Phytophthora aleatoria]|uniref:ABC transporter domain-containing protein n=1 Tax=Phytophthora aleatoria TaxID=2496075 RepID=A0A8J5J8I0_9STRA|nr:hypothetical protein JG688_00005398 [Phytophthora aleatoria]
MWCCGQQPFLKRLSTTKLFGTITGAQANSIIEVDGNAPVLSRKEKRELKRAAKQSKRESSRDQAKRDAAEASSNEISPATSCIVAASQQSRFYSATFDEFGKNVLLIDFALSIVTPDGSNSEKTIEPLVDTQLKLNYGTKYWPIGPNDDSMVKTVLQTVLDADTRVSNVRSKLAIQQRATVVEHSDSFSFASHKAMLLHALLQVKVIEAKGELAAATKIAIKRRGMRGKDARRRQLEVERVVTDLELQLQFTGQMNNERETVRATNEASILREINEKIEAYEITLKAFDEGSSSSAYFDDYGGGWQVRILLAPVLFMEPDMLLLDEQTNHVDMPPHFDDLLVSHDKFFLNEIAEETILGRGQDKKLVYFDGNYDSFEEAMDTKKFFNERLQYNLDQKTEKMTKMVARIAQQASKSKDDKKRQHNVEDLRRQESRNLTALELLMESLGEGENSPEVLLANNANANGGAKSPETKMRVHLNKFGISGGTAVSVPLGALSGGQLARVGLAWVTFPNTPHVLLLDEPTKSSRHDQLFGEALRKYQGTVVLISHDIHFLNILTRERGGKYLNDSGSVGGDDASHP